MARWTVQEVAEKLGLEREVARGLVKALVATGVVEHVGQRAPEGGRAQEVYKFDGGFDERLAEKLRGAGLV